MKAALICLYYACIATLTGTTPVVQQARIEATTSRNQITIAEPFTVTVKVTAEEGSDIEFVDYEVAGFDLLSVSDLPDIPDEEVTGLRNWVRVIKLETLRAGKKEIGPFAAVAEFNGKKSRLKSSRLTVDVVSTLPQETELTSIRPVTDVLDPPAAEDPSSLFNLWWLAGGILAAAFAGGCYWATRRRDRRLTSSTWLKRRIEALRDQNQSTPPTSDWQETFTEELTLIIADHLKYHCGVEMSDFEATAKLPLVDEQSTEVAKAKSELSQLMSELQQAKFAGNQTDTAQRESWCQIVADFIRITLDHSASTAGEQ